MHSKHCSKCSDPIPNFFHQPTLMMLTMRFDASLSSWWFFVTSIVLVGFMTGRKLIFKRCWPGGAFVLLKWKHFFLSMSLSSSKLCHHYHHHYHHHHHVPSTICGSFCFATITNYFFLQAIEFLKTMSPLKRAQHSATGGYIFAEYINNWFLSCVSTTQSYQMLYNQFQYSVDSIPLTKSPHVTIILP